MAIAKNVLVRKNLPFGSAPWEAQEIPFLEYLSKRFHNRGIGADETFTKGLDSGNIYLALK